MTNILCWNFEKSSLAWEKMASREILRHSLLCITNIRRNLEDLENSCQLKANANDISTIQGQGAASFWLGGGAKDESVNEFFFWKGGVGASFGIFI